MTSNPKPITLTADNFPVEVFGGTEPVLVDFWAPWCGPCRVIGPIVEQIATDFAGRAVIGKVNVDEYPDLATDYGVQAIPTLVFFQNGQVVEQVVGVASRETLTEKLNGLLQKQLMK